MAIKNEIITTTGVAILTVPAGKKYAVTTLLVCNTGTDDGTGLNDTSFNMYVYPTSGSASNEYQVLNDLKVSAGDTFTFNVERLILEENDTIWLDRTAPTNLTATISYLEV